MEGHAFCPGHVTGFFAIFDRADELAKRGSRGAGICLDRGVDVRVDISQHDEQQIRIFINEEERPALVTAEVIERLIGDEKYCVVVNSTSQLPEGQGFGMSGAAALATAFAVDQALGLRKEKAELVRIAHEVEVQNRTGLGDVGPQSVGGIVVRKREGAPPHCNLLKLKHDIREIVLCIVGDMLPTEDVLADDNLTDSINNHGMRCLEKMRGEASVDCLMECSRDFAVATNIMSHEVAEAVKAASEFGKASMCMLGNSVFAIGQGNELVKALRQYGDVIVVGVDDVGVRTL
jgi:pantoate kinase